MSTKITFEVQITKPVEGDGFSPAFAANVDLNGDNKVQDSEAKKLDFNHDSYACTFDVRDNPVGLYFVLAVVAPQGTEFSVAVRSDATVHYSLPTAKVYAHDGREKLLGKLN